MLYVLGTICYVLYLKFDNTEYKNKFLLFLILSLWGVFVGNYENADYGAYYVTYNNLYGSAYSVIWAYQVGFLGLIYFFSNILGVNYIVFKLIIGGLSFFLIYSTIKRYTIKGEWVLIWYFIFPYVLHVIQIRSFFSVALIIYAIRYIIEDYRFGKIRYLIFVCIGTSIHSSALFYLPLVLLSSKRNKNLFAICAVLFGVLMGMLTYINENQVIFLKDIAKYINGDLMHLFEVPVNYGFLIPVFLQLLSCIYIIISKSILSNSKSKNCLSINIKKYLDFIVYTNFLMILYFPLYFIYSDFMRIIRDILILNYIYFSIVLTLIHNLKIKILYIISVFIYVLIYWVALIYFAHIVDVINPIFEFNYFLEI